MINSNTRNMYLLVQLAPLSPNGQTHSPLSNSFPSSQATIFRKTGHLISHHLLGHLIKCIVGEGLLLY